MVEARPGRDMPDDRTAERAEITSAGYILQVVSKAARGFAIYLPNNPLHEKFFSELREKVDNHLEEFGPLRLEVEHDNIRCRGETIYTNPDLRENLAFRMYADGIRALVFDEGLEPRELRAIVEIIGRPPTEGDEDDIVTRLWGADLPHVTYLLAEVPPVGDSAALGLGAAGVVTGDQAPTGSRPSQEGAIRRFAAELAAGGPLPPPPPPVAQQIFTITDEELAGLQQRMAEEENRSPLDDVSAILSAILRVEADATIFGEFIEIIGRLCADLLLANQVERAVSLLRMLNGIAGEPSQVLHHAEKVEQVRRGIVSGEVLEALAKVFAQSEGIDREQLRALVNQLGRGAVAPFCQILGDVPGKESRRVLIEALVETGRENPELFLPFLEDQRWYLVRNTIYILRRIATPVATGAVRRCLGHRDARVRKEVLLYFDEVTDPAGEAVMIKLLEDEAPALRMSAARSLARRKSRTGLERLLALTATPTFQTRELEERVAVWEALGDLAPARMLPVFREMLLKRRFFAAAKELDDVACAAAGLRRISTPPALELLREAAAAKKGKPRAVLEEAARAVEHALAAPRPARSSEEDSRD